VVQPWDIITFKADTEARVHAGVLQAWQRLARELGESLEVADGGVGAGAAVAMVGVIGRIRDHVEESSGRAWLASGRTNVALGEWSHGAVDVTAEGVFIHGDHLLNWNTTIARTVLTETATPPELLRFAERATVVAVTQDQAWRHHLAAVSRVLARGPVVGQVTIECVARAVPAGTVVRDEEAP
jgi:hypothetical protein